MRSQRCGQVQKVRLASPFDPYRDDTKRKFSRFHYPLQGGYGAIAQGLYDRIKEHVLLESEIVGFKHNSGLIKTIIYRRQGQEIHDPRLRWLFLRCRSTGCVTCSVHHISYIIALCLRCIFLSIAHWSQTTS